MDKEICEQINILSRDEILRLTRVRCSVSYVARAKKASVVDEVVRRASPTLLTELREAAETKQTMRTVSCKRKREDEEDGRCVRRCVEMRKEIDEERREDNFMLLPSAPERRERYRAFFDATKPSVLRQKVCRICGRECGVMDEKVSSLEFKKLPNRGRLHPLVPHSAQELFEGE